MYRSDFSIAVPELDEHSVSSLSNAVSLVFCCFFSNFTKAENKESRAQLLLSTVHNNSYGKVMFSQVSVKNSVHGGCGVHPLSRHPLGQTPPMTNTPPETTTAADGTHRTGMHSCSRYNYIINYIIFETNTKFLTYTCENTTKWFRSINV